MKPNRHKRHHYRPILHLRHFAGSDSRVWIHDRRGRFAPRQDIPDNLGLEVYLYAPGGGATDPKDDAFETWLADNIDGPAAKPIGHLAAGNSADALTNEERSALAVFIVAQDMRTPKVRDLLLDLFQTRMDAEWPDTIKASLQGFAGLEPTAEDVQIASEHFQVNVTNAAWLNFISRNISRGAERLLQFHWTLIAAPEQFDWLTNDVGIVKCFGSFDNPMQHNIGWGGGSLHWMFPLSSRYALALAPDVGATRAEAQPDWIKLINRQVAVDANDFVFSRNRSDFVLKWWADEARASAQTG